MRGRDLERDGRATRLTTHCDSASRHLIPCEGGAATWVVVLLLLLAGFGLWGAYEVFTRAVDKKLQAEASNVAAHAARGGAGPDRAPPAFDQPAGVDQQALSRPADELGVLGAARPIRPDVPADPMSLPPGLQRDVAMVNWLMADADMSHVEGEAVDLRVAATELVDALQAEGADDATRLAMVRRALVTTMRVRDGSGLLVRSSDRFFVATNAHVVQDVGEGSTASFASPYHAPRSGKVLYMGADVALDDYDDKMLLADDVAFIEVASDQLTAEERSAAWPVSDFRGPDDSERVALMGYPFHSQPRKDGQHPKRLAVTQSYVDPASVYVRTLADGREERAQIIHQEAGVEARTTVGGNSGGPAFAVSSEGFRPVGLVAYSESPQDLKEAGWDERAVRSLVLLVEGDSVRTHFARASQPSEQAKGASVQESDSR